VGQPRVGLPETAGLPHQLSETLVALPVQNRRAGGGELKIIEAILDRPAIEKILKHLKLQPLQAADHQRPITVQAARRPRLKLSGCFRATNLAD
jgi:hypothetical protein